MRDMIIRDATKEDVEALAKLMGYLGYPTSVRSMKDRFERIFRGRIPSRQPVNV